MELFTLYFVLILLVIVAIGLLAINDNLKTLLNKTKNSEANFWQFGAFITIVAIVWYGSSEWVDSVYPEMEERGQFGDKFGAVNALFSGAAFAGIIYTILIQRKELQLQHEELTLQHSEMVETRKEFLLTRTTNLVYKQLERFDEAVKRLEIVDGEETYNGTNAVVRLKDNMQHASFDLDTPEEEKRALKVAANAETAVLLNANRDRIKKFVHEAFNSVSGLKRLVYNSKMSVDELNDLKNLFFDNIGFQTMGVIRSTSAHALEQLELFTGEDYVEHNLEVGQMMGADIFCKPMKEFYHQRLTEGNFDELRQVWLNRQGESG